MGDILCFLGQLYILVLLVRIVLSWFPMASGGLMASVHSVLFSITEPVLGPLRRALPPARIGGVGLDYSPIIVLLVMQIIVLPLVC